ncbi:hypothetical protein QFW80_02935 [Luteimonas sp. M1R5S18]|uniref:Uncharacterized protein n=1 Tax=Luteimonas rhizosphaericola TaxID=3042024 RepID=A0ABT6JFL2_9GAMM|nr:hypothetical protein [Luteimonas rhizosphaericola]MDH5829473.1 hypothetical protein [Luteimonas rhizosphaericola]
MSSKTIAGSMAIAQDSMPFFAMAAPEVNMTLMMWSSASHFLAVGLIQGGRPDKGDER